MTGVELRRLRKAGGFTQRALAQMLGLHPNYFAQLERDEVTIREVVALAVRYVCVILRSPDEPDLTQKYPDKKYRFDGKRKRTSS